MKNIRIKTLKIKFFTILFGLFSACSVYAFGLGDLGNALSGGSGPDLTGTQTELTGSLKQALIDLSKSQALMAKAMGLDEQAMLAEKNQEGLKSGDMGAKDEIEKRIETAASVQEAIAKESAKKTVLDAESKAVFISSIPFYIKGGVGAGMTAKKAVDAGKSLASAGPMALLKVGPLVAIVAEMPGLISKLVSATGNIADFMTANDIDNTEMKTKLADAWPT